MHVAPVTLVGKSAKLVPLELLHADDLADTLNHGQLWTSWVTNIPHPKEMHTEIAHRLSLQTDGSSRAFAILLPNSKAIGMTSYLNIEAERLEIGSTWLGIQYQRSGINTECKSLLLQHAFEKLNCIAVEFRTSFHNRQSRKAIERIGAKLDGILRAHRRHNNGTLRDTCVYSITAAEWPTTKQHLKSLAVNYATSVDRLGSES